MRLLKHLAQAIAGVALWTSSVDANSSPREPLHYLTLLENAKIRTPNSRVHAYSSFDLTFDLHQPAQHIRLALEPNYDILSDDAQVSFMGPDGQIRRVEKLNRENFKVYQGHSFVVDDKGHSSRVGMARITVRRDGIHPIFEGAFTIMGDHHHIQMKSNYMATKHELDPALEDADDEYLAVWRDSDVGRFQDNELRKRTAEPACAADRLAFNSDINHPIYQELLKRTAGRWGVASYDSLVRRQNIDGGGAGTGNSAGVNLQTTIGDTRGCPKQRKVALVGVASDCSYLSDFNSNASAVRDNIINVVNTASDLYQSTFNITLGLRNLTVQEQPCSQTTANTVTPWNLPCTDPADMGDRLNLFSSWRAQQGDTNAYWSLFTKCNTGSEVGLAWLGQLCNHGGSADGSGQDVSGANVIARTSSEWQVFAHETGHTFGAVHDCTADTCANSNITSTSQCCPFSATSCDANAQYLMNPYSSDSITRFSPCTIGNICSALGRNSVQSSCLTDNRGVITVTGAVCGNGIVEGDEECDCGGSEGCQGNTCCDPSTCKYTSGSVCDWTNEGCCTRQCQHATNGTTCRESTGVCDPAETCSGSSGACPADVNAADGTGCGNGLQCASGQCTSRDQQCRTVFAQPGLGGNNDTTACDSSSCVISCNTGGSSAFQTTCGRVNQNFLDGTPCSGGGHCQNGSCQGSSLGGRIRAWINDNKTLFISLVCVIGGLILIALVCCVFSCFRRRNRPRKSRAKKRPAPPPPTAFQQPMQQTPYYQPPPHGGYGNTSVRYA